MRARGIQAKRVFHPAKCRQNRYRYTYFRIDDDCFSVSSYDKQCNDLLAIAAKKARTRANSIVTAGGGTLGGIKSS